MSHDHNHGHDHGHGHGHGHHDHSHAISADADRRYLFTALGLLVGFMVVEVVVGLIAQSLALITDAGHMLTDAGAIGMSLVAMRLASRPATGRFTFGLKRVEILSAQANGLTLLLLSIWFVIEAIMRLVEPPAVDGLLVGIVAIVGAIVNIAAVMALSRANRESLNVEGSFQHILTDLYAFIATAIAGFIIWVTGWYRVDALAALIVAGLMAKAGYGLVRESGRVFLEAAPANLHPEKLDSAIREVSGVLDVDDLHVWEVTSGMPCVSARIWVAAHADCHAIRHSVDAMLHDRFSVEHSTLQTEHQRDDAEPASDREGPGDACVFGGASA
ncbi:cation diffusion facilitator family transporter [Salinisphaera hydrothermalis]|uniref:Cation diffusion facilitator family transporter n=1 Tax=Salinisphaera hydrothermalis (strain C41B8) TaxID=1304275 RepID=A0A084IIX5_SALHC|nr:cation diffusion facilitator family transporter [Salinisphaera hydrothermalis]KEZ76659.1 cation diffusion facilitator family transporter [Salinisphaera hydrothermalis C41B8]